MNKRYCDFLTSRLEETHKRVLSYEYFAETASNTEEHEKYSKLYRNSKDEEERLESHYEKRCPPPSQNLLSLIQKFTSPQKAT